MKIPRDLSSRELIIVLEKFGYSVIHQTGSHIKIRTEQEGVHSITIPAERELKVGTLNSIILEIAHHFQITKWELIASLFGK
ncbi:type II toxin-antitoxin system HicA family toxin [bacterium]|nr:type II toxin-antitoxin system HicA family toxin [bacterium]